MHASDLYLMPIVGTQAFNMTERPYDYKIITSLRICITKTLVITNVW